MSQNWNIPNKQKNKERFVKATRFVISSLLLLGGGTILVTQLVPLAKSYIDGRLIEDSQNKMASPVPASYKNYIQGEFAYYNPGVSYFSNLIDTDVLGASNDMSMGPQMYDIVVDKDYSNPMELSISSIGIENVNITPNVDSYDEKVYNISLKNGLAHFKGTPLPGAGGNSFIYGHSAVQSFFQSHQNLPETIFSKLENVEIGDKVEITKDGRKMTYLVRKKEIIEPDNTDVIFDTKPKETVTLMTCWPLGIGTKRLIVIAELDE